MELQNIFDFGVEDEHFSYKKVFQQGQVIRLFESFAGIGCQRMAFERLGIPYVSVGISEIDKYAIKSYNAIHGDTENYGDICKMETIPECDVFTWSFPCFTADTLVLTNNGNIPIVDIKVGMEVLTHNNRYKKVKAIYDNGKKAIYTIIGMGIDEIKTTENHKFYVREKHKVWNNSRRSYDRLFYEPKWLETTKLTKNHYLGVAINSNSKLPKYVGTLKKYCDGRIYKKNRLSLDMQKEEFWWVIGRYIGDGWQRSQSGIIICDNIKNYNEITNVLDKLEWNYNVSVERTVAKIHIPFVEIKEYVEQFGKGASHKHLTSDILDLPIDYLKSFLDGYFSADGSFDGNLQRASSVSKQLIYDIAHCVAKVYKTPYRIYRQVRKKRMIEGRNINQKPIYTISFKYQSNTQDKAFYKNNYIWFPISKIEIIGEENVYDIEVEDDHSFMANGVIAHNCTDLSKAGKQSGMTGTRSGLVYEVLRLLEATEKKPTVLIMENVPDLVQIKFMSEFYEIQKYLERLGYKNFTQILNAKNYGVAQNRARVFMVSILGDYHYEFPLAVPLELRLKDYLEESVDEKFYIKDYDSLTKINDSYSELGGQKWNKMHDIARRVYTTDYESPTIHTMGGGNLEPKIVELGNYSPSIAIPEATKQTLKTSGNDLGVVIGSAQKNAYIGSVNGTCPTLNAAMGLGGGQTPMIANSLRIRKLTPRECGRLMSVDDEEITKMLNVVSNSQAYKQFGNGLIVDVFAGLLKGLISREAEGEI